MNENAILEEESLTPLSYLLAIWMVKGNLSEGKRWDGVVNCYD